MGVFKKNPEFYADSKFVEKRKCSGQKLKAKTFSKMQNSENSKPAGFFVYNFFWKIVFGPFQLICNQHKILRF
jgi:hypothetical protein